MVTGPLLECGRVGGHKRTMIKIRLRASAVEGSGQTGNASFGTSQRLLPNGPWLPRLTGHPRCAHIVPFGPSLQRSIRLPLTGVTLQLLSASSVSVTRRFGFRRLSPLSLCPGGVIIVCCCGCFGVLGGIMDPTRFLVGFKALCIGDGLEVLWPVESEPSAFREGTEVL